MANLNAVFTGSQIVIEEKQKRKESKTCVVIGTGYSLEIENESNRIMKKDPLMFTGSGKQYKNCDVFSFYYRFACDGLEEAAKELATYLDNNMKEYERIILHMHSKCGSMCAKMLEYLKREVYIVTVSAVLNEEGTPLADRDTFLEEYNCIQNKIYTVLFSNHKVDQDLEKDSVFLQSLNCGLLNNERYQVIVSQSPKVSINPVDWILMLLGNIAKIEGDGIVPIKAQIPEGIPCKVVYATHAGSLRATIPYVQELVI